MATYIGILDGQGTAYGVRIPDLPGANGGGASPDEAIADAISAAGEWVAHHLAEGAAIPPPRQLNAILPEIEEGETPVPLWIAL